MAREATHQVVMPSRGCPYVCTYCCNHALRKIAGGKYVRLRLPDDVVNEIRFLKQRFPATAEIYLQSETIAINVNWLDELTQKIQAFNSTLDRAIAFTCNFRVARAFLTDQVFAALQRANVRALEIGLESGSERLRCGVLRRHYSNGDFFRAAELARAHGMRVNVYNMIGLPGETPQDYWETVQVNRRVSPDQVMTSIFHPYPGTDLHATCRSRGLLEQSDSLTSERYRALIDYPEFPRRQVQRAFDWFDYHVYRGRRPLHYRLRRTLRNKAYSHRWAHAVFVRLLPLWHALRGRS
jgi:tRNA A37 methylthiotransferase MiaB